MNTAYAYCHDCHEITHGVLDTSKGFLADQSSNHFMHTVRSFGDLTSLPAPIFNTIARLGASLPISDNDITMFRLGLDLHNYPTGALEAECPRARSTAPAAADTSPMSRASALRSDASTRSPHASTPTPTTPAPGEQLGLDFGATA